MRSDDRSCVDNAFVYRLKQHVSFINFKDDLPRRCLDLGTGVRTVPIVGVGAVTDGRLARRLGH